MKPTTVDQYINSLPKETAKVVQQLRKTIREELPDAEEVISYSIGCFKINGKYAVYFAGWKKYVSMYPFTAEIEKKLPEASKYKTSGKGTIQFPLNEPLPSPLVRKIVKLMVERSQRV